MKRLINIFIYSIVSVFLLFGCTDYADEIKKLQEQIDALKYEQINSVNDQISSIKTSLSTLQITDKELQLYITQLQLKLEDIEKIEKELAEKIGATDSSSDFLSQLKEYKSLVAEQIESLKSTIKTLQEKDKELQSQISALQDYIDSGIKDAKDWVSATFATLEQYDTTAAIIATIQTQIESMNSDISLLKNVTAPVSKDNLDKAIAASESSIKSWVNSLLEGYYTAEQTDAKIAALKDEISKTGGNADVEKLMKDYEDKLAKMKEEIAESYASAISKAINDYDGTITSRIASEISTVNGKISSLRSDITALETRMTSLENRVAKLEELVNELINKDSGDDDDSETDFPGSDKYETKAKALYFGHNYSQDTDDYVLLIYLGEYNTDGNFVDVGTELALDIICEPSDEMRIPSGTYICTQVDNVTPFHILHGGQLDDKQYYYPSFFYRQYSTEKSSIDIITDCSLKVSSSGNKYSIEATFIIGNKELKWNYIGSIEFIDETSDSEDDVQKSVKIEKFSRATVENLGAIWEDNSTGETLPVDDWVVTLYGENYNTDKEYVMIELLSAQNTKSLPIGKYSNFVNVERASASDFKAGRIIGGYADNNIPYGTWYCKGGNAYYAALQGSLNIKEQDGVYTIDFAFTDTDETYGGSFSGSYSGKLESVSSSSSSSACAYAPASRNAPATRSQSGVIRQRTGSSHPMRNAAAARKVAKPL